MEAIRQHIIDLKNLLSSQVEEQWSEIVVEVIIDEDDVDVFAHYVSTSTELEQPLNETDEVISLASTIIQMTQAPSNGQKFLITMLPADISITEVKEEEEC